MHYDNLAMAVDYLSEKYTVHDLGKSKTETEDTTDAVGALKKLQSKLKPYGMAESRLIGKI